MRVPNFVRPDETVLSDMVMSIHRRTDDLGITLTAMFVTSKDGGLRDRWVELVLPNKSEKEIKRAEGRARDMLIASYTEDQA